MKRALAEPTESAKKEAREKQMQIVRTFRESNFDDLVRRTEPKVVAPRVNYPLDHEIKSFFLLSVQHELIQNRLNELFNSLASERQITQTETKNTTTQKPVYENNFPELFYY